VTPTPHHDPLMGPDFIRDLARRRGIEIVGGSASASHAPHADGTCAVCGGGGYLPDYARWPHTGRTLCACTAREERRRLLSLDKSFVGLAGQGLRDLTPLPCQYASYVRASEFAADPRGWLLMMGEYGTGKTTLAGALAWDVCATVQPVFVKVSRLARELHDALEVARQGQAGAVGAVIDRYADAELAIFDDLGVQPDSAYVSGALMDILDTRHQDRPPRPTVITTNLSMQAIGGRLASRLTHAMVTTTVLVGDDVRAAGLDDQQAAEWAPCWGDARELTDLHKKANGDAFVCAVCASRPHLADCPVVAARGKARSDTHG